eukprot:CAMPEP_0170639746 /NCGR_PEP_ID=MMETSP0224-20130122/39825_1 /TAXON_ID=285029 /ORGANISM="Togula jolla, Strain CCCM 725" /LENGTH=233 /DNA_ID=CAMNT_0010970145 /DNA_START=41 /DNA_END=738 /DNA_ORIENTATION=-
MTLGLHTEEQSALPVERMVQGSHQQGSALEADVRMLEGAANGHPLRLQHRVPSLRVLRAIVQRRRRVASSPMLRSASSAARPPLGDEIVAAVVGLHEHHITIEDVQPAVRSKARLLVPLPEPAVNGRLRTLGCTLGKTQEPFTTLHQADLWLRGAHRQLPEGLSVAGARRGREAQRDHPGAASSKRQALQGRVDQLAGDTEGSPQYGLRPMLDTTRSCAQDQAAPLQPLPLLC